MKKDEIIAEKIKTALISTFKVISLKFNKDKLENFDKKTTDFISQNKEIVVKNYDNLRAKFDSEALKQAYSDRAILKNNLPKNNTQITLYKISEKIRCEIIGMNMYFGINKNINKYYDRKINLNNKLKIDTIKDAPVSKAFELYMIKNFLDIKLNSNSQKLLNHWETKFNNIIKKHKMYLTKNINNQEVFNSKFSALISELN